MASTPGTIAAAFDCLHCRIAATKLPDDTDAVEPTVLAAASGSAAQDSGVDPGRLGEFLGSVVEAVEQNRLLTFSELAACSRQGSLAAAEGVPMGALVDLYLSAVWRLWPELATDGPLLAGQALSALRAGDDGVAALVAGYDEALRTLIRHEADTQRELLENLLSGHDGQHPLEGGAGLGLRMSAGHRLGILRDGAARLDVATAVQAVRRRAESVLGAGDLLVATKGGDLVLVLPDRGDTAASASVEQLQAFGGSLLTAAGVPAADKPRVRLGLGRCLPGPAGVRTSWVEAQDAALIGERMRGPDAVILADRVAAHRRLLSDPQSLSALVEAELAPLRGARGGAGPLVETVLALLDSGSTAEAARRLHLSVRATSYRLARVSTLTGRHLNNPTDRYTLHTAAIGARLLEWQ